MNILVLNPLDDMQKKRLQDKGKDSKIHYRDKSTVTLEEVEKADVIIGNPDRKLLGEHARNLKWLQLCSAGVDDYAAEGVIPKECILTNATGAYGLAVSEHMLAVTMMLMKKLNLYYDNQKNHSWKEEGKIKSICGSVFVIIGLGDIGRDLARKVHSLGAYVIGVSRHLADLEEWLDESYTIDRLNEVLARADVVTMSIPGTKETYHLMDKARIGLLKQDAILINAGRGSTLDLEALCDALENGKLYGAGLDVTEGEPLCKEHRAWDMENLIITPHVAGGFHLDETFNRFVDIAVYNLEKYMDNQPMKNVIAH